MVVQNRVAARVTLSASLNAAENLPLNASYFAYTGCRIMRK
ncbi:MAG: hypothetical protein ACLU4N_10630 [Butyricimonas faecihominis]